MSAAAGLAVRQAKAPDLPRLASLHAACFPDEPWGQPALAQLFATPGCLAVLVEQNHQLCGFALIRLVMDEAEILSIGVLPAWRRRGLGRRLVEAICRRASETGVRSLYLEVAADNTAAQGLYRATGFQSHGRRRHYYQRRGGAPVDALLLRRSLLPDAGATAGSSN